MPISMNSPSASIAATPAGADCSSFASFSTRSLRHPLDIALDALALKPQTTTCSSHCTQAATPLSLNTSTMERLQMAEHSTIEWTDATWNPVRGCTKISPGCKHCYAEAFAERFRGVPGHPYQQGFDLKLVPAKIAEPLRWLSPKMIFVNSMSDLFHEGVPDDYIEAVARVMVKADWHTYQVLTKRSPRMAGLLN